MSRTIRRILSSLLLCAWVGCQTPGQTILQLAEPRAGSAAKTHDVAVPAPPGLADQLEPRSGPGLERAHLSLAEAAATLPRPAFLSPASPPSANGVKGAEGDTAVGAGRSQTEDPVEPPLVAQRFYIAGRLAYLNGDNYAAITKLKEAHRLAPNRPAIARLLGKIYSRSNRVQAVTYLESAVRLDPQDIDSLFLLGRHALHQGRWSDAIVTFAHVLNFKGHRKNVGHAIWLLAHFHLATALERAGFDQAAIDEYGRYFKSPRRLVRSIQYTRDLYVLRRQSHVTWRQIGDAHHRLGRPAEALEAYRQTGDADGHMGSGMIGRLAYTYLRLGQPQEAQRVVLSELGRTQAGPGSVQLLKYLTDHGLPNQHLPALLQQVYRDSGRSAEMVLSIAAVLEPDERDRLLLDHLAAKPADGAVFRQLMNQFLAEGVNPVADPVAEPVAEPGAESGAEPGGAEPGVNPGAGVVARAVEALEAAATIITNLPAAAPRYSKFMFETGINPATLLEALDRITPEPRHQSAMQYLRGKVLDRLGRWEEAAVQFDQARGASPAFEDAHLALARLRMEQGRHEEARQLIGALPQTADPRAVTLRARMLAAEGQTGQAVRLLDELITKNPSHLSHVLVKAQLQRSAGEVVAAELTLRHALHANPKAEALYDALFALYESPGNLRDGLPDQQHQREKLMLQALREVPNSWMTRLKLAEISSHSGQSPSDQADQAKQAEQLFTQLMAERPNDFRALDGLTELLWRGDRLPEADALIDRYLRGAPHDPALFNVVLDHFWRTGRRDEANRRLGQRLAAEPRNIPMLRLALRHYSYRARDIDGIRKVTAMILQTRPPDESRDLELGWIYLHLDQPAKTTELVRPLLQGEPRDPVATTNLLRRALGALGQHEQAQRVIEEAIEKFADHRADLMLELAMFYDGQNQSQRAEQTMLRILEQYPDHPDTNNSLGYAWANGGRHLARAKAMIEKAVAAEPNNAAFRDSLGWVHYKRGQFADAVRELRRARGAEHGENPIILDHLGDAHYRLKDPGRARQSWQAALKAYRPSLVNIDRELEGLDTRLDLKLKADEPEVADVPE